MRAAFVKQNGRMDTLFVFLYLLVNMMVDA